MMMPIVRRERPRPEPELTPLPVPEPKPKLEMLAVPVFRVKRRALEAYIATVYRFEFDFLIATGQSEGMAIELAVTGEFPNGAWSQRAHELRCGKRTRDVNLILNVLACDEFIPKGKYVIDTHPEKSASFPAMRKGTAHGHA